ncbi:MAG: endonuclease domain-containing protein, partial [Hymenobacteraceae bacterium]|nr:endonuclease domain-containing protein [Hymenobacteraceae bacterium]MDX5398031.1 endonuclease domain-containing protein [Hymenobacteraceae bacterium]MDX5514102.1 endonuclease domain-containing protein [Hymenobacteraceae bacterium]
ILHFIVDFYCPAEKLVIELDGQQHFSYASAEADAERTRLLNQLGLRVIRFENKVVCDNLEGVLEEINQSFR